MRLPLQIEYLEFASVPGRFLAEDMGNQQRQAYKSNPHTDKDFNFRYAAHSARNKSGRKIPTYRRHRTTTKRGSPRQSFACFSRGIGRPGPVLRRIVTALRGRRPRPPSSARPGWTGKRVAVDRCCSGAPVQHPAGISRWIWAADCRVALKGLKKNELAAIKKMTEFFSKISRKKTQKKRRKKGHFVEINSRKKMKNQRNENSGKIKNWKTLKTKTFEW